MKFKTTLNLALCISTLGSASFALPTIVLADGWDSDNDPKNILGSGIEYREAALPTVGEIDQTRRGWPDSYWPEVKGGIAYRWQTKSNFKKNQSYNAAQASGMSAEELNVLSPSEKFDLLVSDYKYSLTKELRKANDPKTEEWHGLCDGWSAASLQFDEPQPVVVQSADGKLNIPFTSSDIKALLAYYVGRISDAGVNFVGTRCTMKSGPAKIFGAKRCGDVNAGAFHIVLTNQIGKRQQGFISDLDQFKEIWNYPIIAYKYDRSNVYKKGSKNLVDIHMTIKTKNDEINPQPLPMLHTNKNTPVFYEYWYTLELSNDGRVVGGDWDKESNRPDFLWTRGSNHSFEGKWASLKSILGN